MDISIIIIATVTATTKTTTTVTATATSTATATATDTATATARAAATATATANVVNIITIVSIPLTTFYKNKKHIEPKITHIKCLAQQYQDFGLHSSLVID